MISLDKGRAELRSISIDALRALIMVLMIFVNDLWSLIDIPQWLEHVDAKTSGMGLADIVFPAFLFIVGLSVPYAIESRKKKGDADKEIFLHIITRSIALLVMGFFHVNMESYSDTAMLSKPIWQIAITVGFFLIWLDYSAYQQGTSKILKAAGIVLLIIMALLYKNNQGTGVAAMRPEWWGILGLIGWAYLTASCIFLFTGGNFSFQILAFVFFMAFNSASNLGWLNGLEPVHRYIWFAENGAMAALTMSGIIASLIYRKYGSKTRGFWVSLLVFAFFLALFGGLTTPLWGISKIRATPSWVGICAAITMVLFGLMVYFTEILNQRKWYEFIKPAGTSTLTCYLLPYIHYALIVLLGLPQLPEMLRTGVPGLIKSLIYALTIVFIAGLLGKRNIRLKI